MKFNCEIFPAGIGQCEIRFWDGPDSTYRSWTMSAQEMSDLLHWWHQEGHAESGSPVKQWRRGSILISMPSHSSVHVQGFYPNGKPRMFGYSLPTELVETLADRFGKFA